MKRLGKTTLAALALALFSTLCTACYSSSVNKKDTKMVTTTRNIGYFSRVKILSTADVKFVQGKTPSMRITGNRKMIDNIEVELTGETLIIKSKGSHTPFGNNAYRNVTVYITSPDLTAVNVAGAGDFYIDGTLDTDNLDAVLVGAGDMKLGRVVCDNIRFAINGAGDIEAKRVEARSAKCAINGAGDINIDYLRTDNADLTTMGAGDIEAKIYNAGTANMTVIGAGDIETKLFDCGIATAKVTGSGDITLAGNAKSLEVIKKGCGDINTEKLVTK